MTRRLLAGERDWLANILSDLSNDVTKLEYADWLEDQGDSRCEFLRDFVKAKGSMNPSDFPNGEGLPEEWLELIGYRLLKRVADKKLPELKDRVLRLARPALRMKKFAVVDERIAIGASKLGGLPDLPQGYPWPQGGDCHANFFDDVNTAGREELAGFLAQLNLAEIVGTQAARALPQTGLLSFFRFIDCNTGAIGVKVAFFPELSELLRTKPPTELTDGNEARPPHRLKFKEILDLPYDDQNGPWGRELKPDPDADYGSVLDYYWRLNLENVLGYGRGTTGGDPTPSKEYRHLIMLDSNGGYDWLHIQIHQKDLAAHDFDKIILAWVG